MVADALGVAPCVFEIDTVCVGVRDAVIVAVTLPEPVDVRLREDVCDGVPDTVVVMLGVRVSVADDVCACVIVLDAVCEGVDVADV